MSWAIVTLPEILSSTQVLQGGLVLRQTRLPAPGRPGPGLIGLSRFKDPDKDYPGSAPGRSPVKRSQGTIHGM